MRKGEGGGKSGKRKAETRPTLTRPRSRVATSPTLLGEASGAARVGWEQGLGACPELAEGVRALFQWKFMAPIRVQQQMPATHEPTLR